MGKSIFNSKLNLPSYLISSGFIRSNSNVFKLFKYYLFVNNKPNRFNDSYLPINVSC